jgi:hypothetical protein
MQLTKPLCYYLPDCLRSRRRKMAFEYCMLRALIEV